MSKIYHLFITYQDVIDDGTRSPSLAQMTFFPTFFTLAEQKARLDTFDDEEIGTLATISPAVTFRSVVITMSKLIELPLGNTFDGHGDVRSNP